ncbi:MAG: ATP-binding protein [Bacteroidota bacterium]|nr:ATP-binding protein [Bacteroidota bacterium]
MSNLIFKLYKQFVKRRFIYIVFFILLIIVLSFLVEKFFIKSIESNWGAILKEKTALLISQTQNQFQKFQNYAASLAAQITNHKSIIDAVSGGDEQALFRSLKIFEVKGGSIEVYDSELYLLGWSKSIGSDIKLNRTSTKPFSYIEQGSIFSWLLVVHPIMKNDLPIGYVFVKKLFDVNYPLSNRFISSEIFEEAFTQSLNYPVSFDFSNRSKASEEKGVISIPFKALDGNILGYGYRQANTKAGVIDEVKQNFSSVRVFLIIFLSLLVLFYTFKIVHIRIRLFYRALIAVAVLWIVRFLWLAIDFPTGLFPISIFDPSYFASGFGFGVAKSIGELLITSIILITSIVYIGYYAVKFINQNNNLNLNRVISLSITIIFSFIFLFLLRGYVAITHSVVFDSSLSYIDPAFPPFVLLIMYLCLFLISAAFVLLSTLLILYSYWNKNNYLGWLSVFGIFIAASFIYGELHPNPLTSNLERSLIVSGLLILGILSQKFIIRGQAINQKNALVFSLSAVLLAAYFLFAAVQIDMRSKLKSYASEVARPVDNWIAFMIDEALNQIATKETADRLKSNDDLKNYAFTEWAKTILSREGYNCRITIINGDSRIASNFQVGSMEPIEKEPIITTSRSIMVREDEDGFVKHYVGNAPVYFEDGTPAGSVRMEVTAVRGELFRSDSYDILKTYTGFDFKPYYKNLFYSEYINDWRIYTSNREFESVYRSPYLSDTSLRSQKSFFVEEKVDSKNYEMVYVKAVDQPNKYIAISGERGGVVSDVLNFLRLLLFFLVVCCSIYFMLWVGIAGYRKRKLEFNFRTKLLIAFIMVSVIPIIVISYYNREFATQRASETNRTNLEKQTDVILSHIKKYYTLKSDPLPDDKLISEIAASTGVDFSLYSNGEIVASSKPELLDAELIDRRISPDVYYNINILGRHFFVESQAIGTFGYLVGYQAVINKQDQLVGIIAVPTLYNQASIEEDLQERNAYLLGVYTVVLLIAFLLGIFFAGQISKPIRRLTDAAIQVGEGNYDYKIPFTRTDELGKLEQTFNEMIDEIKQKREELIKYEKELAWKEMAKQVAHEIKNPLTPIKLAVQHLQQAYKDKADNFDDILKKGVSMITEQVETLTRIASEFSNFARLPFRKIEKCDLNEILKEAIHLFEQYKNVNFKFNSSENEFRVNADKEELRRAFINIIRNSIQAMNEQGTVSVIVEQVDKNVQINIHDTGQGISDEIKSKIFEPNFSTKTDGMGLGLAIVKKTIDDSGGAISFITNKDTGTTFIITLPI